MVETPFPLRKQGVCIAFLAPTDPEWERAWSTFPDREMWNADACEALQYMGSAQTMQGYWRHEFRHRAVPGTNERRYWYVTASEGWEPTTMRETI